MEFYYMQAIVGDQLTCKNIRSSKMWRQPEMKSKIGLDGHVNHQVGKYMQFICMYMYSRMYIHAIHAISYVKIMCAHLTLMQVISTSFGSAYVL